MRLMEMLQSLWDPTRELVARADDLGAKPEGIDTSLKQLHIQIHHRLGSPYPGDHRGLFKGHGMDLKDLREYQPGDEIRKIDWNVFARTGVPHVKEHYEEKQIPVWFFLDRTASMHFGQCLTKFGYACQLMGALGLLALEMGHRVGLIVWQGEKTPMIIKPGVGLTHLQWLQHEMGSLQGEVPALAEEERGFPNLPSLLTNRGLVFLISDFTFLDTVPEALNLLTRLSPKHEVYSLLLVDPIEEDLTYKHGWLPLCNESGNNVVWVNTSDRWLLKEYRQMFQKHLNGRKRMLSLWSRFHKVSTQDNLMDAVMQLMVKAS